MSRRIVQIAAVANAGGVGEDAWRSEHLYALDNNGVAWFMNAPTVTGASWYRLAALPSIDNPPRPRPPATTLEQAEGVEP
jgi:hypothetical protein